MWPTEIRPPQKNSAPLNCRQPRVKHNLAESAERKHNLAAWIRKHNLAVSAKLCFKSQQGSIRECGRVPQEGIEPPTLALGVPCSVLLSYWGVRQHYTPDAWATSA